METIQTSIILFILVGAANAVFSVSQKSKLEDFITEAMKCNTIPGLTMTVVRGNETWAKGFGKPDVNLNVTVDADTLFGIGSVTKAFTTTLLAMLLEKTNGRFTWTSKVKDILVGDFAFVDEYRTKEMTLRDLVTHRTGLHTAMFALSAGYEKNLTRTEFARRIKFLPAVKELRDEFEYNNIMFGLAGHIVEVLSGESYEETLRTKILQPLGMNKTRVLGKTVTVDDDGVARPYIFTRDEVVLTDSALYNLHPCESAGAIASSANDMAKWLHFHLSGGKTADNVSLISPESLQETYKIHQGLTEQTISLRSMRKPLYPVEHLVYGYGYGWFTSSYKGYRKIFHGGILNSYRTVLHFYPDLNAGIYISLNLQFPGVDEFNILLSCFVSDLLLNDDPWVDAPRVCMNTGTPFDMSSMVSNEPVTNSEAFTGTYGHRIFGDIQVTTEGNSLQMHYNLIYGPLNTTNDKTSFVLDARGPYEVIGREGNSTFLTPVRFRNMVNGKYTTMDINPGTVMTYSRDISFKSLPTQTSGKCRSNESVTVLFIAFVAALRLFIIT